jgi:hypothetical protein
MEDDSVANLLTRDTLSRRRFLTATSTGLAGTVAAGRAAADTLADVPPRVPSELASLKSGSRRFGAILPDRKS